MNKELRSITARFFNGSAPEELTEQQIASFINEYPYSLAARLIYLQKLRKSNETEYKSELFSTSLYLNNPLYLENLLTEDPNAEYSRSSFFVPGIIESAQPVEVPDEHTEFPSQEFDSAESLEKPEFPHGEEPAPTAPGTDDQAHIITETAPATNDAIGITLDTGETHEVSGQQPAVPETPPAEPVKVEKPQNIEEPAFEPYHTVDYFASQGIRLKQSELGKDKLGQQLRSFTEWLRSMKRLPDPSSESPSDDTVHQTISTIAADSLQEKEVITEAMAEVWAKQGNRHKAIDIYQKLSLQNPSKSPYFAAKIDQLNKL